MKAPQPLQFRPEDLPEVPASTLTALNTYLRQVAIGLANQLTLSQNAAATIRTQTVTTADDETTPTFLNSWIEDPAIPLTYRKDQAGVVWVSGRVTSGTVGSGTPVFTLPASHAPAADRSFAINSNAAYGRARVMASGDVAVVNGSNTNADLNFAFRAADKTPPSVLSSPLTFTHGLRNRCTDLLISAVTESSSPPDLSPSVTPDWYDDGKGNVVVRNLGGLAPLTTYSIRFICLSDPA